MALVFLSYHFVMPSNPSNPYPVTSVQGQPTTRPRKWWRRILLWNVVLMGVYGGIALAAYAGLGGANGSLTGGEFGGDWTHLMADVLLVIGIGIGLPNFVLFLAMIASYRRV